MKLRSFFKKIVFVSVIVIFPILTSACSSGEPVDGDGVQTTPVLQEKRVGILKSLGGLSIGDGTHLLEMSNNKTMRLRSLNIDLDSEKYLSKKVEVRGTITQTNDGQELMDVQSIDLSENGDEEIAPKGEQIEYKNADLGFKLKYLDNWTVEENELSVTFSAPRAMQADTPVETEPDSAVVERLDNPDKQSPEEFLNLPSDMNEIITLGFTKSKIGVDQLDGLKNDTDIYVSRDKYMYHLSFNGLDVNNRINFFNMVASFQFIGFTPDLPDTELPESANDVTTSTATTEIVSDSSNDNDSVSDVPTSTTENVNDNNSETLQPATEEDVVNNIVDTSFDPPINESPAIIVNDEFISSSSTSSFNTTSSGSSYTSIASDIGNNINSISPIASENGSWTATSFEFVDPNYVYVVYSDGTTSRRVLLTYDGSVSTTLISYFEPGETTSWERVTGENPVESEEKTVYSYSDGEAQEETVVKEGYRYFESLPYHFQAQYPSSWYYNGNTGSEDVKHHYGFSNEPVEEGNELINIDIIGGSLPSGSPISVGLNTGVKVYTDEEVVIYIEGENGNIYKIHGGLEYESYVVEIAGSIESN